MKRINYLVVAMLSLGATVVSSCSNDVVTNDVDGVMPETRSVAGAYLIKTMGVTMGVNTENFTFTYGENNKLTASSSVKGTVTKSATYDYATAGKVIVVNDDPGMGEAMRYTYTLNADGYVTEAEEAYDSDGYLNGKMKFVYDGSKRLSKIQVGDEVDDNVWNYTDVIVFTYSLKSTNYKTIKEDGVTISPVFNGTWLNKESFDMNLLSLFGIGSQFGDVFTCAVFADLFPNAKNLMSVAKVNDNNKIDFAYTMSGDKATACIITTTGENTDEDTGETEVVTSTTNVTFGY